MLDVFQRLLDSPFTRRFPTEFDALFNRATRGFDLGAGWPAINVREDAETVVVTASLPGCKPEELMVKVEGDTLTLAGERPAPSADEGRVVRAERRHGRFEREIALPVSVRSDDVKASYEAGILTVVMPKSPEARPQVIQVTAN